MNVLHYVKGNERFIFIWTDENRGKILSTLGKFASDKDLQSFDWMDATTLAQRIRNEGSESLEMHKINKRCGTHFRRK